MKWKATKISEENEEKTKEVRERQNNKKYKTNTKWTPKSKKKCNISKAQWRTQWNAMRES